MVYQGSKAKLAKDIIPILQDCIDENWSDTFIDLFCGGCNVIDKIKCENRIANDFNKDLILLLQYAQKDNLLSIAPSNCTFQHYSEVRSDRNHEKFTTEYRALIGYMASYGGRYFDGGYAREKRGEVNALNVKYKSNLNNLMKQAPMLDKIKFLSMDYKEFDIDSYENAVIYLDPPYKGTKQYHGQSIEYEEFYDFCKRAAKKNHVFISEYWMPDDFKCIWQKERKVQQKSDREAGKVETAIEKLYTI